MADLSTYGSKLVVSKTTVGLMIALRSFVSMFGCKLEPYLFLVGDKMVFVMNITIPSFTTKEKHQLQIS